MIDFVEAVKRPLRTDPITIVLGVLFTVFTPLRPLMHGLGIELSRRTQHGNETMPKFDDFVDLFLSGLIVYVIAIIYFIPMILALIAGAAVSLPSLFSILQNFSGAPGIAMKSFLVLIATSAVFGVIAFLAGFLAAVMLPVGIQLYAHDKKIGSAFDWPRIWKVVSHAQYWVTWILLMGFGIVLLGVIAILSIPEFNALSILFLGAAGYLWWMTAYIMFAETVKEAGVLEARGHIRAHVTHRGNGKHGKFAYKKK